MTRPFLSLQRVWLARLGSQLAGSGRKMKLGNLYNAFMELSKTIKLLIICRLVPNREPWYKARSSQSYESMGAIQVMNVHNWIGKMYNTCYCH